MSDMVNHPAHYEEQSIKLEPIDFCERLPFCLGNTVKYCFRAGHKEGASELQDLKKAQWYLKRQCLSNNALRFSAGKKKVFWRGLGSLFERCEGILGETTRDYLSRPGEFYYDYWRALAFHIADRIKVLEPDEALYDQTIGDEK